MKCSTFKNKLNEYMEGSLSYDMENAMKKHMDECIDCRILYTEEEESDELLNDLFSAKDIEFNSSRGNIIKNINQNKYKKNKLKKVYYFIKSKKIKYSAIAAVFVVGVMLLSYVQEERYTDFKYLTVNSNKNNIVSTVNNKKEDKEMQLMNILRSTKVFGANIINNNKLIVKQEDEEGKVYLELVDFKSDKLISKRDLSEDFNGGLCFDGKFIIKYNDYNGDGSIDFAIGQKKSEDTFKYVLYTIKKNKIQKIKFENEDVFGKTKNYEYSPLFESNSYNSLIIPVSQGNKIVEKNLYIWNKKNKEYYFERKLGKEDNFVYIPELKKENISDKKVEDSLKLWEDSPNNQLSISFLSDNGLEKERAIYVKNLTNEKLFRFNIINTNSNINFKYGSWIDDENIAIVMEVTDAKNSKSQYIYTMNLQDGETKLVYKTVSNREKINSIKFVENGYEYECTKYDDGDFKKSHKEKWIIPINGTMPINISIG